MCFSAAAADACGRAGDGGAGQAAAAAATGAAATGRPAEQGRIQAAGALAGCGALWVVMAADPAQHTC